MSDTDRMQPIGKIPSLDYSTGREVLPSTSRRTATTT